jgi:hypothetical protein
VQTQKHTNFFRDLHLISSFKCSKKVWIFFDRVQWTHLTMVPKVTFELCPEKKIFSPKINQANNVFDLQNDFHEDRLSFPV